MTGHFQWQTMSMIKDYMVVGLSSFSKYKKQTKTGTTGSDNLM